MESALECLIDVVTDQLRKGNKVTLTGFGTFKVSNRAAREGINPQTKAKITIPAMTVPKFTAGKTLKEASNNLPYFPDTKIELSRPDSIRGGLLFPDVPPC